VTASLDTGLSAAKVLARSDSTPWWRRRRRWREAWFTSWPTESPPRSGCAWSTPATVAPADTVTVRASHQGRALFRAESGWMQAVSKRHRQMLIRALLSESRGRHLRGCCANRRPSPHAGPCPDVGELSRIFPSWRPRDSAPRWLFGRPLLLAGVLRPHQRTGPGHRPPPVCRSSRRKLGASCTPCSELALIPLPSPSTTCGRRADRRRLPATPHVPAILAGGAAVVDGGVGDPLSRGVLRAQRSRPNLLWSRHRGSRSR